MSFIHHNMSLCVWFQVPCSNKVTFIWTVSIKVFYFKDSSRNDVTFNSKFFNIQFSVTENWFIFKWNLECLSYIVRHNNRLWLRTRIYGMIIWRFYFCDIVCRLDFLNPVFRLLYQIAMNIVYCIQMMRNAIIWKRQYVWVSRLICCQYSHISSPAWCYSVFCICKSITLQIHNILRCLWRLFDIQSTAWWSWWSRSNTNSRGRSNWYIHNSRAKRFQLTFCVCVLYLQFIVIGFFEGYFENLICSNITVRGRCFLTI